METSYKKIVSAPSVNPSSIGNEKIGSLRSISFFFTFIILLITNQMENQQVVLSNHLILYGKWYHVIAFNCIEILFCQKWVGPRTKRLQGHYFSLNKKLACEVAL